MRKTQRILILTTVLFIVGIALLTFMTREQPSLQAFPATVQRDCAPWDGGAFTVHIPMSDGTAISVSIWQSPDIQFPRTFSFPDDTGQIGNASLFHPNGFPEPLVGTVFFSGVDPSTAVEGRFDLKDESGTIYQGTLQAEWDDQTMLCG